jgi:hypothetical protein
MTAPTLSSHLEELDRIVIGRNVVYRLRRPAVWQLGNVLIVRK